MLKNILCCCKQKKQRPLLISIEGNVASGKSSLLFRLSSSEPDWQIIMEPTEKWQNYHNSNLLELMYSKPERWSYVFQSYISLTRFQQLTEPTTSNLRIIERSLDSSRFCFIEYLKQEGLCPEIQRTILTDYIDWFTETLPANNVDIHVYLRLAPEICYERMKQRMRKAENDVTIQRLIKLHHLHEAWLLNSMNSSRKLVVIIDGSQSREDIQLECREKIKHILKQYNE